MNFKKYNFMFVFLFALIIAIPIVSISVKTDVAEASNSYAELPPVSECDTDTTQTTKSYNFKNAWQAYNQILSSTLNKSYTMKTIQTLTASADVGVTKLNFDQKVTINSYKTLDGQILEETVSSGTKNFFSSTFYDGKNTVYTKTVDGDFTSGKKPTCTPDSYSKADYLSNFGVMPAFVLNLTKSNSDISGETKSGTTYKFTITIRDSSVWKGYVKKIKAMSGSEDMPNITNISFNFEVSTKTGKLLKMTMNEEYKVKYSGLNVTCYSTSCKAFYDIGTDIQLPSLSYMGL